MNLYGMNKTNVLKVGEFAKVNLAEDTLDNTYSIGLTTSKGIEFKMISKELHDLLVKELKDQEGKG